MTHSLPPKNNKASARGGASISKETLTISPGPRGSRAQLSYVCGSRHTCHPHPSALPSCSTKTPLSILSPLANCPPPHPSPHLLGTGFKHLFSKGLGVGSTRCQNGPSGRAGATCFFPAPDASPAVAFPLSTTSSSSSWLGSPSLSFHPPTHPTHRPSAMLCC